MAIPTITVHGHPPARGDGVPFRRGAVSARLSQAGRVLDGDEWVTVLGGPSVRFTGAGDVSLSLVPNDKITPAGTAWVLTWSMLDADGRSSTVTERVSVASDAPADLGASPRVAPASAVFVPGAPGQKGDKGDRGDQGLIGPVGPTSDAVMDLVRDFSAAGDGVTSNAAALSSFQSWLTARYGTANPTNTRKSNMSVRVSPGTYLLPPGTISGVGNFQGVHFIGSDRDSCILRCSDPTQVTRLNIDYAENVTLWNVSPAGYAPFAPGIVRFRNCRFVIDPGAGSALSSATHVNASPAVGGDVEIERCVFEYPDCYIPLRIYQARNIAVRECSFTGSGQGASHALRIEAPTPGGRIWLAGNRVAGSNKTGLFLGSYRGAPISGVCIEGNEVSGVREEGISLDGFGNNSGVCAIIGTGTISAVANDGNGWLVVTPALQWHDGTSSAPHPISMRSDWTDLLATFGAASGIPGTVCRILAFDSIAGTLTLSTKTPATAVTGGGMFSVMGGFLDPVIRENTVRDCWGTGGTYATGISLWLGVLGAHVIGNRVYDCANGLSLSGGRVLGTYEAPVWNTRAIGNEFHRCQQAGPTGGAILCQSRYGGAVQYGNRFRHSLVNGGAVNIDGQDDNAKVWDASNELVNGATLHAS